MKLWYTILIAMLLFPSMPKNVPAGEVQPAENLSQLIDAAISNNPELKASEARWQMFQNRIAQAGSLEDPMLMLKIQNGIVRARSISARTP